MRPGWLPRWKRGAGDASRKAQAATTDGPRIRVISRERCHLCDEAMAVVEQVAAERAEQVEVLDVDADPTLQARYTDLVPVVVVDGREIATFRVTAAQLHGALDGAGGDGSGR